MPDDKKDVTRRDVLKTGGQLAALAALGAGAGFLVPRASGDDMVWQINPGRCIQCGNCADYCVLKLSAVKCVHAIKICGYCMLCFGYFAEEREPYIPGAEYEICPTAALKREHIKDQFHEYTVDEEKCIACAKCVKGCRKEGNGSLYLQVRHDRCVNCSQCAIAEACPSNAFVRVHANDPYIKPELKTRKKKEEGSSS
jgi:electron transport complex protein RnfB